MVSRMREVEGALDLIDRPAPLTLLPLSPVLPLLLLWRDRVRACRRRRSRSFAPSPDQRERHMTDARVTSWLAGTGSQQASSFTPLPLCLTAAVAVAFSEQVATAALSANGYNLERAIDGEESRCDRSCESEVVQDEA